MYWPLASHPNEIHPFAGGALWSNKISLRESTECHTTHTHTRDMQRGKSQRFWLKFKPCILHRRAARLLADPERVRLCARIHNQYWRYIVVLHNPLPLVHINFTHTRMDSQQCVTSKKEIH